MSEKEFVFKKFANAQLQEPIITVPDWDKMYGNRTFGHKNASFTKLAADQTKYLLSHVTIMASVMTEEEPEDFKIKPECSHLVNNNDDAWENTVLKLSYKSFVGAFNFVEHFQNSKYAKGHIIDAVLRKVQIAPPDIWVYYVDLLVGTDLAHDKLVTDIRDGKVKYLSMGCVTDLVICSFCGAHVTDQSSYCNHLSYQKGTFLTDDDGVPRRVAELCGHKSMPNGGVRFVEASWVATPAFPGAAKRNVVAEEWVGPKTPYTRKAASLNTFQKAASQENEYETLSLGEALLDSDDLRGRIIR
jgi:hypothetical protein